MAVRNWSVLSLHLVTGEQEDWSALLHVRVKLVFRNTDLFLPKNGHQESDTLASPLVEGEDALLLNCSFKKNAEECLRQGEILKISDQFRYRLHLVKIIKDRCKNVSTYPCTFAAKEVLDWLVERKEAPDRETAMKIMQRFMEYNVIHHVCDHHTVFKDAMALYRFREDDGTFMQERQTKLLRRAERMYMTMIQQDDAMLKHKESDSEKYSRIFRGSELVDWLVRNREVASRLDGEVLGCAMVQYGILQHVSRLYNFSDSNKPYQFAINFRRKRKIMEILEVDTMPLKPDSESSPFCLRKLGDTDLPHGGFFCVKVPETQPTHYGRRKSRYSEPTHYTLPPLPIRGLPSVLTRFVSVEELLEPGAPFLQKLLTILSDAVGWGFVIRGTGPCHVQAVDPGGPAAAAGMQVRQFLRTVNGMCCLRLDYQTINRLIVAGPKRLVLEVLEPFAWIKL